MGVHAWALTKDSRADFVHIIVVSSKCDTVGPFPACIYPLS